MQKFNTAFKFKQNHTVVCTPNKLIVKKKSAYTVAIENVYIIGTCIVYTHHHNLSYQHF